MVSSPVRNVLLNKAGIIERCIQRAREEYAAAQNGFRTDYSRQDAAIVNIQRACEACIDMGQTLIRAERLELNKSASDIFTVLQKSRIIPSDLATSLKNMIGFRNIAVHQYQELDIDIVIAVLEHRLDNLLEFVRIILQREA